MSNAADSETKAAVIVRWNNQGSLKAAVPGGIASGRLKPATLANTPQQNNPYAVVECKQGPRPNVFNVPDVAGQAYVDYREVAIILRGVGEQAMGNLLAQVKTAFDSQPLTFPSPTTWMRTEDLPDSLEEEDATKAGEDIWRATARYCIWTNRVR